MSNDDANEIIEIRDPEIDAETIMHQIRENIHKRRAQAEAEGLDYEAFLYGLSTSRVSTRFDDSLYSDLRRMGSTYSRVGVGLSLTDTSIPIIGPLVQRVRTALHQLVLYYVNLLAAQQRNFNGHIVRVLMTLVKGLEKGPLPGEVESLQQELAQLRAQVEQLQAQIEQAKK
jgi:hypothetical protein